MVFFPNCTIELWEYTETSELDSYLEPKKTYQLQETVECDFQSMSPKDMLSEFGEILQDTYKIYLDINTEISSSMVLRVVGQESTYQILGTPMHNNHLSIVQHKKIVIQKHRKPVKLGE